MDVSVDCALFGFDGETLQLLLIQQRTDGKDGIQQQDLQMALPGNIVQEHESLTEAAGLALHQLTGLSKVYLKQFHAFGHPRRVQDAKDRRWLQTFREFPDRRVITVAYFGLVSLHDHAPKAASFAGKAKWVDVNHLPSLAFDHNEIANMALATLRAQLDSQHMAFEMLPEKFTLRELQLLHEVVWNRKLDKRNFRKNVKRMDHVVGLNEKEQGVLHKPAQLFTYDSESSEQGKSSKASS